MKWITVGIRGNRNGHYHVALLTDDVPAMAFTGNSQGCTVG